MVNDIAVQEFVNAIKEEPQDTNKTYNATVSRVDKEGIVWVNIHGSDKETPTASTSTEVKRGDNVVVNWRNNKLYIGGNYTNPSAGIGTVQPSIDYINDLVANSITVNSINAATGYIEDLTSKNITTENLAADHATIKELDVESMAAATAYIRDLTAENITADDIIADHATIDTLDSTYATIQELHSDYAEIDLANVNNAWIEHGAMKKAEVFDENVFDLSGDHATIRKIDASKINVANLNADNLIVRRINGQPVVGGYTLISPSSSGYASKNPQALGWYEFVNAQWVLSTDTTVDMTKAYYQEGNEVSLYDQNYIDGLKNDLQQQIDGAVETYTGTVVPTLVNWPYTDWYDTSVTPVHDERAKHVGDIYYVVNSASDQNGYCYRFAYDNTQHAYDWVLIKDSDVTKALSDISDLQTFESETTSWIDETDEGLETIRTNYTALSGTVNKTVKESIQLWFTKANTTAPAKPNSVTYPNGVTSDSTAGNDWRIVVPAWNASYPNYFYCWQYKFVDGTFGWSNVVRDIAMGETQGTARDAKNTADAALPASTFEVFESTTFTDLVDEVDEQSTTMTNMTTRLGMNADGTGAATDIVAKESALEQTVDGISTRVGKTETKLIGMYATSTTAAGTAAKVATITPALPSGATWELGTGTMITVKFMNENTAASPTLNVNSKGAKGIRVLNSSGTVTTLSADEYKWAAGSTFTFTYNGTYWLMQDSSVSVRMNSNETSISQTADSIVSLASNQSTYTKPDGTTGTNAIKSAITQTANSIESVVANNDTYTAPDGSTKTNTIKSAIKQNASDISLRVEKSGVIAAINASVEEQGGSAVRISADKVNIEGATIFTSGRLSSTSLDNAYDAKGSADDALDDAKGYVDGKGYQTASDVADAVANGVSGKADKTAAIAEEQRIYYRSKVNTKPNGNALPSTWITNTGNIWNDTATVSASSAWSRKVTPVGKNGTSSTAAQKYLYLWTCIQKKTVSGTVTYGDILLDDSTTIIDGGTIITGTVNANAVNASSGTFDVANIPNLNASKITAGDIAADRMKAYSITAINSLTTGKINAARLDVGSITVGSLSDGNNYSTTNQMNNAIGNAVDSIEMGGENIALEGTEAKALTAYNFIALRLAEPLEVGQTYTLQLWGITFANTPSGNDKVSAYWGGGNVHLGDISSFADGYGYVTFTPSAEMLTNYPTDTKHTYINLYNTPPSSAKTARSITVERWKLEKGNKSTAWSPSYADRKGGVNMLRGTAQMMSGSGTWESGTFRASGGTLSHIDFGAGGSKPREGISGLLRVTNGTSSAVNVGLAQDRIPTTGAQQAKVGYAYTLSCFVRCNSTAENTLVYLQPLWKSSTQTAGTTPTSKRVALKTFWQYISYTGTLAGDQVTDYISGGYVYAATMPVNGYMEVCALKLEFGTSPSAWSAGEGEDMVTRINNTGIAIHPASDYTNRTEITADGMNIYKSDVSVAQYGDTARIGKEDSYKTLISSGGIQLVDGTGTNAFSLLTSDAVVSRLNINRYTVPKKYTSDLYFNADIENYTISLQVTSKDGQTQYGEVTTVTNSSLPVDGNVTVGSSGYYVTVVRTGNNTFRADNASESAYRYLTVSWTSTAQQQAKILYTGANTTLVSNVVQFMQASQTVYLSEPVSSQLNGIVLAWSAYSSGTAQNWDWNYTFVPKNHVLLFNGNGVSTGLMVSNPSLNYVGAKYVKVYDDRIEGYAGNESTGTANGITYANNHWVLRYVYGV